MHEPQLPPPSPAEPPSEGPAYAPAEFSPFPPIPAAHIEIVEREPVRVTIRDVACDIADVLLHPRETLAPSRQPWQVWSRILALYAMGMVVAGLVVVAGVKASGATNLMEDMKSPKEQLTLLILAGIVAPLWEETAFRLPLARFHVGRVLPSLALVGLLLGVQATPTLRFFILAPLIVGAVLVLPTIFHAAWRGQVSRWWGAHFHWVLTLSIIAFGLAHGTNYRFPNSNPLNLAFIPLLVLPQLVGGALLAYTRQKLGFWFGVLLHASVNSFLVGISILASNADVTATKPAPKPSAATRSRRQPPLPARAPARPADNASASAR